MKYSDLVNKFRTQATALSATKLSTDKFRAAGYNRVASLIEKQFDASAKVKITDVKNLDITQHMKQKAVEFTTGKKLRGRSRPKTQTKDKQRSKSPNHNASRQSSRSKSRTTSNERSKSAERQSSRSKSPNTSSASIAKLLHELTGFMGIGEERAKKLIADGLTHINQLHRKKWFESLPEETKLFIKLKPDSKIPHAAIAALEPAIKKLETDQMKIQLVGSYRRQVDILSDVDIMLVSTEEDAIDKFLEALRREFKTAYPYSKGADRMSIILAIDSSVYKFDVFRVDPTEQAAMLLYSTGSKEFNIRMRSIAKKKGYLLNQHGLYDLRDKKKIELTEEKDYFDILSMEYLEPKARIK